MYYIEFPSTTEVTKQKSIVNFNATFGSQNVSPTWRPGGVTTPNDSPSGTTVGTEAGPSIGGAARCSIRPPPQPPRRPTPPNPLSSNLSRKWCVILRRARRCRECSSSALSHAFTTRHDVRILTAVCLCLLLSDHRTPATELSPCSPFTSSDAVRHAEAPCEGRQKGRTCL